MFNNDVYRGSVTSSEVLKHDHYLTQFALNVSLTLLLDVINVGLAKHKDHVIIILKYELAHFSSFKA